MKKWALAAAVIAFGAALAVASPQQETAARDSKRPASRNSTFRARLARDLRLTAAQEKQIDAIEKATLAENAAFFKAMETSRKDYAAARRAKDRKKLEALKAKRDTNRDQLQKIMKAQKEKILGVLTVEQRERYDAAISRRERRQHKSDKSR